MSSAGIPIFFSKIIVLQNSYAQGILKRETMLEQIYSYGNHQKGQSLS